MNEIHLDTVDSTNNYAKTHSFAQDQITCITAEEQTAGRGRYQRKWISPRGGNIYATFYFKLPLNTPHLTSLAQIMAYSFATVLLHEGLNPKIKWPNDIQLNEKKLSGILCETIFNIDSVDIYLGIGINVNLENVTQINQPATSLFLETGHKWDKYKLLKKIQRQFSMDLELFKSKGFTPFHNPLENLLAYKGKRVSCHDGAKIWTGVCHSLTFDGQLNICLSDHTIHTVTSGDLTY